MLMNGLSKGVLMLVVAAAFTWVVVVAFENRAAEGVSEAKAVPAIEHAPGKRDDKQGMF